MSVATHTDEYRAGVLPSDTSPAPNTIIWGEEAKLYLAAMVIQSGSMEGRQGPSPCSPRFIKCELEKTFFKRYLSW